MRLLRICAPLACLLALAVTRPPAHSPVPAPRVDEDLACRLYLDPHDYFTRVVPPAVEGSALMSSAVQSNITVNYTGFTPQAQAAFQAAVDIWQTQVKSSVRLVVDANFADLGVVGLLGSAGSSATRGFTNAPRANTFFVYPIANKNAGVDLNPSGSHIRANFNSTAAWSYGIDGVPVSGKVDFISVVLHELGHGLGFLGTASISNGLGSVAASGFPYIYDVSVVDSAGTSILNTATYPNSSATLASLILGTGVSGPGLFWNGTSGVAANGGARPQLFAPSTYLAGSTYSHLDDATYPAGNLNSLMTHSIGSAEVIHTPGPIMLGMFNDMGWGSQCSFGLDQTLANVAAAGGSVNVTLSTTAGCPWTASAGSPFVSITAGANGSASAVVRMTVSANASASGRVATVTIGDQTLTIAQAGTTPCTFQLGSASASVPGSASSGSVNLTTGPGCGWFATSNAMAVATITNSPANGQGSATVGYAVSANPGLTQRSATLTIGGQAFTITQGGPVPLPVMTVNRSALYFGAVTTGVAFTTKTASQTLRMTQSGPAGTVTWTAASNVPWITVSPASGSGPATFTVNAAFAAGLGSTQAGAITVAFTGASTPSTVIPATLRTMASVQSVAPNGAFDTPADLSSGLTGSIAVTGWATDDVDVARVRIMRDPVAGEAPGVLVFVGDATLVEGARPDVQALFPTGPRSYRAGWGYLLLTNFLPGLGNGTYRLTAIADDLDGHSTVLGSKTITCTNSAATAPFGAIDTPAQGETISGGSYVNFGWVLSAARRADPPGGGTVRVVIDGAIVAQVPSGWTNRSDLSALFAPGQFSGIGTALGAAVFDTTALSDGVHTISWIVTDNQGAASGIGSRYFRVANGAGVTLADPGVRSSRPRTLTGRRGFDLTTPSRAYEPDTDGWITIQAEELDRIELQLAAGADGYSLATGQRQALPIGSHIDPVTGTFTWNPGVGFVGSYDLVLDGQHVRMVLNPKGSGRVGPQTVIDLADGDLVAGWAADLDGGAGTGVDTVHVWAYPVDGGDPIFLGASDVGGARPDVAAVYGDRFLKSGYGLPIRGLAPGTYDLAVFAYSTVRGGFVPAKTARVTVR